MSLAGHKELERLWDGSYDAGVISAAEKIWFSEGDALQQLAYADKFALGEAVENAIKQVEQRQHRSGMAAIGSIGSVLRDYALHRQLNTLLEQWNSEVDDWRTSKNIPLVPAH